MFIGSVSLHIHKLEDALRDEKRLTKWLTSELEAAKKLVTVRDQQISDIRFSMQNSHKEAAE